VPDAHLLWRDLNVRHVEKVAEKQQTRNIRMLTDIAEKQGSQIIAASHSEVILNQAADRDIVIAFVGEPHRIDDRGSQVLESLSDYHVLARLVPRDMIDPEVTRKLDAITQVAANARPRKD
jgi:hypothetical protein